MRIWVGVHPYELDINRILEQHRNVHYILGTIRNIRATQYATDPITLEYPSMCLPWSDGKGLAAIIYYHMLIGFARERHGFADDDSPLTVERKMLAEAGAASDAIANLFDENHLRAGLNGTPKRWPPRWITDEQKIADLMDLQERWAHEPENTALLMRSKERYGSWPGGTLAKFITPASSVTPDMVERYRAHKEAVRNAAIQKQAA